MQNKLLKILKDKSGASLLFVLGIMLLLMAIGVSALVAASANTGFVLKQEEHSRIMILHDSVHKNIMYSLQNDTTSPDLLSAQLVTAIYNAADTAPKTTPPARFDDIVLGMAFESGLDLTSGDIRVQNVTLSFPMPLEDMVVVTETLYPASKAAKVNFAMDVTVEINAKGKVTTTRASYEYTNGELTDETGAMAFTIDGYGEWRLVRHETIDAKD